MHLQPRICRACGKRTAINAAFRPFFTPVYSSNRFSHHTPPSHTAIGALSYSRHRQIRLGRHFIPEKRRYHSYDRPSPPPFPPAETAILTAALQHVPQHGFSTTALSLGARNAGYLDISKNLFPRGVFDLINFHLVTRRLALKYDVQFPKRDRGGTERGMDKENGKGDMSVEEKVRALMMGRLRANGEVLGRWREAHRVMAQPRYVPASLAELGRLADEFLFLAGDTTVDTGWYTKRAALSAIYSATEIYMTTMDTSKNFADTKWFLDRRLDRARTVGYAMGSVGEWIGFSALSTVNVLRSKGVRI